MKISYDAEADALSITFRDATVTTKHLAEGIAADYDSEGRLAGLEIQGRWVDVRDPQVLAALEQGGSFTQPLP